MKTELCLGALLGIALACAARVEMAAYCHSGAVTLSNVFTHGTGTMASADLVDRRREAAPSMFTAAPVAQVSITTTGATRLSGAQAEDLAGDRAGFTNLIQAYGLLTTMAGAGGRKDANNWRPGFEGGPAANAVLSGPHIAIGDRWGEIFIADKDAHAIRKVRLDGTIVTAAGINVSGNGPDEETKAIQCALSQPNGLCVKSDGTVFILDLGNRKIRRLATNGLIRTLFNVSTNDWIQRGLWVSEDEALAYVTTFTAVKKWVKGVGVKDFATGFSELGNIAVDPQGNLVVTDRGAHRVYRLDRQGNRSPIAGNGTTSGGGDGRLARSTGLEEVRGIWFLSTGAYFICTHRGSQVWYVDAAGYIHLFLNGNRKGAHAGDGTWFYSPNEYRVSECRAVTVDHEGNVLITESDAGYIRKVEFLPYQHR